MLAQLRCKPTGGAAKLQAGDWRLAAGTRQQTACRYKNVTHCFICKDVAPTRQLECRYSFHAKDISRDQGDAERGKVTGTPVGCACGDGVIDWERVLWLLKPLPQDLCLSVECGTVEDAERSIRCLRQVREKVGLAG